LGSDGVVRGTPTAAGTNPVLVKADYKGKSATQSYAMAYTAGIAQFSGFRAWSDGTVARTCKEYLVGKAGYAYFGATGDGIYRVDTDGAGPHYPMDTHCDMTTDGGGWTVVQRRVDGQVNFYRPYQAYAQGFTESTVEYYAGNARLAHWTATGSHSLRFDLTRTNGQTASATYANFKVAGAEDGFRLVSANWVGGTAGDSFSRHVGMRFTTFDVDNDGVSGTNCATVYKGAWWYEACHASNLNGQYLNGTHESYADGINWLTWTGYHESLAKTEMKIREH
jgi:ficolin